MLRKYQDVVRREAGGTVATTISRKEKQPARGQPVVETTATFQKSIHWCAPQMARQQRQPA